MTAVTWGRLFALEVAAFLTLGLLAAMHGNSLVPDAQSGVRWWHDWLGIGHSVLAAGKNVPGTLLLFVAWLSRC